MKHLLIFLTILKIKKRTNPDSMFNFSGKRNRSKEDIESIKIRIERQTLYKPENSNLILFSIRVRNYPINEITDNKSLGQNFYLALEGLSEEMIEYKGLTSSIGLFKAHLKSFL